MKMNLFMNLNTPILNEVLDEALDRLPEQQRISVMLQGL